MKFKHAMSKLLTNKMVLYVVFALFLLNSIGYLMYGKLNLFIGMLLIGGLTSFFTKNMILVLLVPLIIINFLASSNNSMYEGMETANNDATMTTTGNGNDKKEEVVAVVEEKKDDSKVKQNGEPEPAKDTKKGQGESFEVGRKKNYDLDYASTVEDAYSELNKLIGGDGIQRLTSDTQNLMKQQLQLAEAMKSMGPLIDNMKPIMESMGPLLNQANGFMNIGK
jgi:hypothetical protein